MFPQTTANMYQQQPYGGMTMDGLRMRHTNAPSLYLQPQQQYYAQQEQLQQQQQQQQHAYVTFGSPTQVQPLQPQRRFDPPPTWRQPVYDTSVIDHQRANYYNTPSNQRRDQTIRYVDYGQGEHIRINFYRSDIVQKSTGVFEYISKEMVDGVETEVKIEFNKDAAGDWYRTLTDNPIGRWYSAHPGKLCWNSPVRRLIIPIIIQPTTLTTFTDLFRLSTTQLNRVNGRHRISIPATTIQQYLVKAYHDEQNREAISIGDILPLSIWLYTERNDLPIPLQIQLYSRAVLEEETSKTPVLIPWLPAQHPNPYWQIDKPIDDATTTYITMPGEHSLKEDLLLSYTTEERSAEFNRWINVDWKYMDEQLRTHLSKVDNCYWIKTLAYDSLQKAKSGQHCNNNDMLQFLCVWHWKDMVEYAITKNPTNLPKIVEDTTEPAYQQFVIPKEVLDYFVASKFKGELDRNRYVMNVKDDLVFELSVLNKTSQTPLTEIEEYIKHTVEQTKNNPNRPTSSSTTVSAYFKICIQYVDREQSIEYKSTN